MIEIQGKIKHLQEYYSRILDKYKQLGGFGDDEKLLIQRGQMEQLVEMLHKKETILAEIGQLQLSIQVEQDFFVKFYALTEFSVPELVKKADSHYQQDLSCLQAIINELVMELEILAQQEIAHEQMLNEYAKQMKYQTTKEQKGEMARKAYHSWERKQSSKTDDK